MKSLKLTTDVQENIIDYLRFKFEVNDSQEELDGLMKMISPSLRY